MASNNLTSRDVKVSSTGGLPCIILPKDYRERMGIEPNKGQTCFIFGYSVLIVFPPDYKGDLQALKDETISLFDFMIAASKKEGKRKERVEKPLEPEVTQVEELPDLEG